MKIIPLFFILAGTLLAKPSDYDSIKRTKLIEWVEQLQTAANSAKAHAEEADQKLIEMQETVTQTKAENIKLQSDIKKLTEWGISWQNTAIKLQEKVDELIKKLNHVLKKLHFWKWFGSLGLAAIVLLILLRWPPPLANPWAIAIVYLGFPGLAFGAVWAFL